MTGEEYHGTFDSEELERLEDDPAIEVTDMHPSDDGTLRVEATFETNEVDTTPEPQSHEDVLEALEGKKGQAYVTAAWGWNMVNPYHEQFEEEFGDHVSEVYADAVYQAQDARGIPTVWPWEQIISVHEVSSLLVEALGGEPGEPRSVGAGFAADEVHEQNLEQLRESLGGDVDEEE